MLFLLFLLDLREDLALVLPPLDLELEADLAILHAKQPSLVTTSSSNSSPSSRYSNEPSPNAFPAAKQLSLPMVAYPVGQPHVNSEVPTGVQPKVQLAY